MSDKIPRPLLYPELGIKLADVKKTRILLDVVFNSEKRILRGMSFMVANASSPGAHVRVCFNREESDKLRVSQGFVVSSLPFSDIYFDNDQAQPGEWVEIHCFPVPIHDIDCPSGQAPNPVAAIRSPFPTLSLARFMGGQFFLAGGAGIHNALHIAAARRTRVHWAGGSSTMALAHVAAAVAPAGAAAMASILNDGVTGTYTFETIAAANLPAAEFINWSINLLYDTRWGYIADVPAGEHFYIWDIIGNQAASMGLCAIEIVPS